MKITYRAGKLYFDDEAWALIKVYAKKTRQSPHTTVMAALKRGIRNAEKKEGMEPTSLPRSRRP